KPLEVAVAHRDLPLPPFPHAVPAEVARLVGELTAKDPAARPASAEEVAARADRLREDLTEGAAAWLYSVPASGADMPAPGAVTRGERAAGAGHGGGHRGLADRRAGGPGARAPAAPRARRTGAAAPLPAGDRDGAGGGAERQGTPGQHHPGDRGLHARPAHWP